MNTTQKQRDALKALSLAIGDLPSERKAACLASIETAARAEEDERMTNNADPTDDPDLRLYPLSVISKHYGVSVRTLLRRIHDGELKAVRIGKGYSVSATDLKAWIEAARFPASWMPRKPLDSLE